jgi:hypothetical protein
MAVTSEANFYSTEILFTPEWHWWFSTYMGDLKGELGYIDDYNMVHLISKRAPEVSKFEKESDIKGPTTSLTAKKGIGSL